jgi:5-formyltetrahydrofolate cyclo-ligase
MDAKHRLRKQFLARRFSLATFDRRLADQKIFTRLTTHPKITSAGLIGVYISNGQETDTHRFIRWCLAQGKSVCVPRVQQKHLTLHMINSLTDCPPGYKGIPEPPAEAVLIPPQQVEVMVVLGLAFDRTGHRLGYGQGHTDRLLKPLTCYTIGLCYQNQLTDVLPHQNHDVPVVEVITA